jgi:hypothetical protein
VDILAPFIGSVGVVVSAQSISYDEVSYWINEKNWWVDVFNVTSAETMHELWKIGATVAPKSLSQVGFVSKL